ncbi:SETD2 [Mytilus coruscus]|uniref:SETD2 n=1 Tax=Mytilus coruscus TaxID=42192 RepID=A0A6J8C2J4_MYTCO|nr:SETD2 [Mytilus coruscus]
MPFITEELVSETPLYNTNCIAVSDSEDDNSSPEAKVVDTTTNTEILTLMTRVLHTWMGLSVVCNVSDFLEVINSLLTCDNLSRVLLTVLIGEPCTPEVPDLIVADGLFQSEETGSEPCTPEVPDLIVADGLFQPEETGSDKEDVAKTKIVEMKTHDISFDFSKLNFSDEEDIPPPPSPLQFIAPVLPPNWKDAKDSTGKTYYFNVKTRKTQWTPPIVDNQFSRQLTTDMDIPYY